MLEAALEYARDNREALVRQYEELLAIPSVSTLPEHKADVEEAAQWLAAELRRLGMARVETMPAFKHPIVYAQGPPIPGKPTILVYGHYDVQPVDPLDEWHSAPFEPTRKGDYVYARGASDMKGSMMAFLKAVEALVRQGGLPVNVKFLLEGEEEIGSPGLPAFVDEHRDLLEADVAVNCDAGIHSPTLPSIVYALRGLAYFEIEVAGPRQDLHSGVFGGVVHNPAQVLCSLIAGMHDADGKIMLPGFYDRVRPLSGEERETLARVPVSDEDWRAMAGAPALRGEKGYNAVERAGARPSLDVNGLVSGFTQEGAKTVLPAKALAKVSMRLVADQEPSAVAGQLRAYMRERAPDTVSWEVRELSSGPGAIMDRGSPAMRVAVAALRETFGADPIFKREGGSVPVVGIIQQKLGIDSVMLGFALPDDGIHGPNERQYLPNLFKGVETYIRFMTGLALQ